MNLQVWSKRAVVSCVALWALLVAIYITLAAVSHETLPQPYNTLIIVTLSTSMIGSGTLRLAVWLRRHLEGRVDEMGERAEVRDGRLYYEMARLRGELSQIRELLEHTEDLTRPALALAGSAYDNGYADGLARQPMAKVLPMGSRDSGS